MHTEGHTRARRIVAALLSFALAWSGVPLAALAEGTAPAAAAGTAAAAAEEDGLESPGGAQASSLSAVQSSAPAEGEDSTAASDAAPSTAGKAADVPEAADAIEASGAAGTESAEGTSAAGSSAGTAAATAAVSGASSAPASKDDSQEVTATVRVIGPGAGTASTDWLAKTSVSVDAGTSAAELTENAFALAGLKADIQSTQYGAYLSSIASPIDGTSYAYDAASGKYWQLFVDGTASSAGMSDITVTDGMDIVWYYSAWGDTVPAGFVSATVSVIGPDAEGNPCAWLSKTSISFAEGATAEDLTKTAFAEAGITSDIQSTQYGAFLSSIASPIDRKSYAYDAKSGDYWQLFVDGTPSSVGMSAETLAEGADIVWYYSGYGDALPGSSEVVDDPSLEVPDPSVTRTEGTSEWAGYAQGMAGSVVAAETPTSSAGTALAWKAKIGEGVSDPVLVAGKLYLYGEGWLRVFDAATGTELASKQISTATGYFCRPVYAEGLLVVPLQDGRLMAYTLYNGDDTASSLKLVWETPRIVTGTTAKTQALSSLTVTGGRVFAAFSVVDWLHPLEGGTGYLVSASLADGSSWMATAEHDEYYWAGAAAAGTDILIADERGYAMLVSGADGSLISEVDLGCASHAGIMKASDKEYLAVTTDGVLHVLSLEGKTLSETASVSFADYSTSTPSISDGIAFVGGRRNDGTGTVGTLSAIDLSKAGQAGYVPQSVDIASGQVQSAPLVVTEGSLSTIYVTANALPGSLYAATWKNGTLSGARTIFEPEEALQNWCTASPAASPSGLLFYTNDSGYLFALKKVPTWTVSFETQGGSEISDLEVASGKAPESLPEPARDGYAFKGWYLDAACTVAYDASDPSLIAQDGKTLTLYAKWEQVPGQGGSDASDDSGNGPATGTPSQKAPRSYEDAGTGASSAQAASVDAASDEAEETSATAATMSSPVSASASSSGTGSSAAAQDQASPAASGPGIAAFLVPAALLAAGIALVASALRRRSQER